MSEYGKGSSNGRTAIKALRIINPFSPGGSPDLV